MNNELFGVRPRHAGFMDQRIQACFPEMPPMVGFAAPATFRSADPPREGDVYTGLDTQLESFKDIPGPPVVVFQDIDSPSRAATFGEIMCTTYQTFGAVGLITSGTGRDLDQVRAIGFPTFTDGTMCAHGYCHFLSANVPVHVGGITIYPGDLLHGDCNGVTTIPNDIATEVANACEEFMAAEEVILEYLRSGSPETAGFSKARKECGARIAEMGKRLKR
jgi:4-hydroxy-4-methyl-2-oxoglutarate aldolase